MRPLPEPASPPLTITVKRVRPAADLPLPAYSSDGATGMDLHANIAANVTLAPSKHRLIATGIAIQLPPEHFGSIRDRSSLAKQGVHVLGGVIDEDYRGEIWVCLICLKHKDMWLPEPPALIGGQTPLSLQSLPDHYRINPGDRIAQLIVQPYLTVALHEAESLADTERGAGGFGSTGA